MDFLHSNSLDLLPSTNNNQILFSQKLDTLFFLQNLYLFSNERSIAKLSVDYLLSIRLLEYNYYVLSEKFLKDLADELNEIKNLNLKSSFTGLEAFMEFECLFVIFHEFFHHLFKSSDIYHQDGLSQARKIIQEVHNTNTVSHLNLIKKTLYNVFNFKHHVEEILNDPDKVEEFACDLYAWNVLLQIVQLGGSSEDEVFMMCIACIIALQHLEEIKLTDDIMTHSSYEYEPVIPRSMIFYSRVNILEYSIRLYIYTNMKNYKEDFETTLSEYETRGRNNWIVNSALSFRKGIVLKNGAEIGERNIKNSLLNNMGKIENDIYKIFGNL